MTVIILERIILIYNKVRLLLKSRKEAKKENGWKQLVLIEAALQSYLSISNSQSMSLQFSVTSYPSIKQFTLKVSHSINHTCRASIFDTAIAPTYGKASITASARSLMKSSSQPRAGTRPQFFIPDSKASSRYSTSISSSVSICSLTKLRV